MFLENYINKYFYKAFIIIKIFLKNKDVILKIREIKRKYSYLYAIFLRFLLSILIMMSVNYNKIDIFILYYDLDNYICMILYATFYYPKLSIMDNKKSQYIKFYKNIIFFMLTKKIIKK